jgi:hypothetical protein
LKNLTPLQGAIQAVRLLLGNQLKLGSAPFSAQYSLPDSFDPSALPDEVQGPVNLPPNDQSSGQGTCQGQGSGIGGGDNPFGNWDGQNNAAFSGGGAFTDLNNNGIPDDIDSLLSGN